MNQKETQIVETIAGTWLRFPSSFRKFHVVVELSGQLALNMNTTTGSVHVYQKEADMVYRYTGELRLTVMDGDFQCQVIPDLFKEQTERAMKKSDAS